MKFDKELEKKFQDDFFERSLLSIRTSLILAFFLYAAFGILDIWIVPESKEEIWFIRFAIVCPLIVVTFIITYKAIFRQHMQLILSIISIVVGMGIVAMIAITKRGELGFVHYYAGLFLVLMWNYTLLRLRFVYATISSLILVGGYEFVAIYDQNMLAGGLDGANLPIFLNNNFFFLSSNVIGMLICYTIENYMRMDFRLRMDINKAFEELQQSKEYLVQVEKEASLGQMVAGVAHEINTPVGIGVTAASHLVHVTEDIIASFENRTARKNDMDEYFATAKHDGELILKNLYRTSELVKSFKMVSADQTSGEKRKFKMKAYIEDIILSLRPRLQKTKHKVTVNCPEDFEMDSYPGAFAQVITNLLINSLNHAYDDGDSGTIHIDVSVNSEEAVVKYSDDGKGISQEDQKKIFDPFFTTNRSQGGTGLGLNIVLNIVNQTLKGKISCESEIGKGTVFQINLPLKVA